MTMNTGEAIAAQALIDWVTSLTLWERTTHGDVQALDEQLVAHVHLLAKGAFTRLGAGPSADQAAASIRDVLGLPPHVVT